MIQPRITVATLLIELVALSEAHAQETTSAYTAAWGSCDRPTIAADSQRSCTSRDAENWSPLVIDVAKRT